MSAFYYKQHHKYIYQMLGDYIHYSSFIVEG